MLPWVDRISWPVRTERLLLRPAADDDLEATWRIRRLEPVSRWLTRAPATLDEYRVTFEDPEWRSRMLVVERGDDVIGDLMLRIEDAWAQVEVADAARDVQAELGWVLDPDHVGQGLATEAVLALIRLCFVDLGLRRVEASCFLDNEASWRLMERVGMRREAHTVRESLHRSGQWLDGLTYALLADEWRSVPEGPPASGEADA